MTRKASHSSISWGYFHVSIEKEPMRVVIDLSQVLRSRVTEIELGRLFLKSPFVRKVEMSMEAGDNTAKIVLATKVPVVAEVFKMPSKDKASRIVIDIKKAKSLIDCVRRFVLVLGILAAGIFAAQANARVWDPKRILTLHLTFEWNGRRLLVDAPRGVHSQSDGGASVDQLEGRCDIPFQVNSVFYFRVGGPTQPSRRSAVSCPDARDERERI